MKLASHRYRRQKGNSDDHCKGEGALKKTVKSTYKSSSGRRRPVAPSKPLTAALSSVIVVVVTVVVVVAIAQ
jgi:hypothetical protein